MYLIFYQMFNNRSSFYSKEWTALTSALLRNSPSFGTFDLCPLGVVLIRGTVRRCTRSAMVKATWDSVRRGHHFIIT